jgi:pimeloyl-ACP methyl ester carboxylesterase
VGPRPRPYVGVMDAIDWQLGGTWPHPPRWFDTAHGRMHYVDLGPPEASPVVLVHGNPTWGYLYRAFVPALLAAGRRVIVPDHLGFGRSDHPSDPAAYAVELHLERLSALLDALSLEGATLVLHDWGAPLGLGWAVGAPERVAGLVVLNGFVRRPTGRVPMPLGLRLFRLPVAGELAVQGLHGLVRAFVFRAGMARPERLDAAARAAYLAPNPTYGSRAAQLAFARAFPAGPDGPVAELLGRVHAGLAALRSRPALIAWGGRDVVFGDAALAAWREDLPQATVLRLPEAGHLVQEDAPEVLVPAVVDLLARIR